MLTIQIPSNFLAERTYILSVLLDEFLGLDYTIQITTRNESSQWVLTDGIRTITLSDCLFSNTQGEWLTTKSLPQQPLKIWNLTRLNLPTLTIDSCLPIIYGQDPDQTDFFQIRDNQINLGIDIFGSSFFMLTRYEEVVKSDRDRFDRFPATASLAYQEYFLDRPIVNEYLEVLWSCINYLWPNLQRRDHQFKMCLSHDVDEPFRFALTGLGRLAQRCAGDIRYRKSLTALGASIKSYAEVKFLQQPERDPSNTFDLIMDLSEANNIRSAFYFITDHSAGKIDGVYTMDHPLIRQLLRKIHDRGHEIGLHTSYNTYLDTTQTVKEFTFLKQACEEEGIIQDRWGGRQHYLRWSASKTFRNWDNAGLDYDSTLSYADQIGFRCGTCYEYSAFDLSSAQPLKLKERPLCIMEASVIRHAYMGLSLTDGSALQAMKRIKERCRLFNGIFTLLWHNTGFTSLLEKSLYQEILNC
jgi:peptidoglycan/xylan/chitin deacetylase (PgdA/CDA1 family)